MSKRTALADTQIGKVRVQMHYKRGDWAVTDLVSEDAAPYQYRVTHLPTGCYASTLWELGYFNMRTAKRIVDRYAKELPRCKTIKGMAKHGKLGRRIICEEVERKA